MSKAEPGDPSNIAVDIYHQYILPIIRDSKPGDELLFVTPSTFFGFYSIGVRTYEEVCQSLRDAKDRRVKCRVLVDVKDVLTATAAEGLLSFLDDGDELRDMERNPATYFLMLCRVDGKSKLVRFATEKEKAIQFLPGVSIRPFAGVQLAIDDLDGPQAYSAQQEFETLWSLAQRRLVKDAIIRYEPSFYFRKRFDLVQAISLLAFFLAGSLFGIAVTVSKYEDLRLSVWVIFAYVISAMLLGIGANLVTNFIITRRGFGRN